MFAPAGERANRPIRSHVCTRALTVQFDQVYPAEPSQVDARLASDILRDSLDPGALNVMASGAKLPPPRTLNELFVEYAGPVLVLQGVQDPLNDAKARADGMERIGAKVVPLAAGHCPHDEKPTEVGRCLEEFAAGAGV